MYDVIFPVIDPAATGKNIVRLRKQRGLSVRDMQAYFGFEEPQAIYKWQSGKSLPSIDNLYALGALLQVPMEEILVSTRNQINTVAKRQQDSSCCLPLLWVAGFGYGRHPGPSGPILISSGRVDLMDIRSLWKSG